MRAHRPPPLLPDGCARASTLSERGVRPLVVNLDGTARVGGGGVGRSGGPRTEDLLAALDRAREGAEFSLILGAVSSDNRRFAAAGFPALGLSVGLSGLHTPADTADRVESEALRRAGVLLLATAQAIAYAGSYMSTARDTCERFIRMGEGLCPRWFTVGSATPGTPRRAYDHQRVNVSRGRQGAE